LAMVNAYHSFRNYFICLGNGYRLIFEYKLLLIAK